MTEQRKNSVYIAILLGLACLILLPILLIAVAVFEEEVIGSHYVAQLYVDIGVFGPLDWLIDNTLGRFF